MRLTLKPIPAVSLTLLLPMLAAAAASPSPSPSASRFAAADQAFQERRDPAKGRKALELYRAFYKATPEDPEAAWRVGMGCYFVGIRLTKDEKEQEKIYAEGRDAALTGSEINNKCGPCHFWAAINMALYGQTVGIFKMIFSLNSIQDHLKQSLAVDPTIAHAGAYRLLGLIQQKVPGILGGSNDRAKEYFQKAIETAPDEPLNYIFMARLLYNDLDEHDAALKIAREGLKVQPPTPDRIESIDALKDLQDFLKDHSKP